jgi:hypothetical protein
MKARNIFVACLLLAGCNSFNNWNWEIYRDEQSNRWTDADMQRLTQAMQRTQAASAPRVVSEEGLQCPLYALPELPEVPKLPIPQLAKVPANAEAIDAIQQKHIEDLRRYITSTRKLIRMSYDKYLEDCRNKNHSSSK